jgi:hypothetical protein
MEGRVIILMVGEMLLYLIDIFEFATKLILDIDIDIDININ